MHLLSAAASTEGVIFQVTVTATGWLTLMHWEKLYKLKFQLKSQGMDVLEKIVKRKIVKRKIVMRKIMSWSQ